MITGQVQTESQEDLGAIDDDGNYRVQLYYDGLTNNDGKQRNEGKASKAVRMAQPSAGADRKFHMPLKSGTEVILSCVNGDPDRPIITGAMSNPHTSNPVTAENKEKLIIQTNKNTIEIDDREARWKLMVDGTPKEGSHELQIGQPNSPELGFVTGSINNVTTVANQGLTTASAGLQAFRLWKTGTAVTNILDEAGFPNPITGWKKILPVLKGVAGLVKFTQSTVEAVKKQLVDKDEQDKKEADEALSKAKTKLAETITGQSPVPYDEATAPQVANPDGTSRPMTESEARDAIIHGEVDKREKARDEADDKAQKAQSEGDHTEATKQRAAAANQNQWLDNQLGPVQKAADSARKRAKELEAEKQSWDEGAIGAGMTAIKGTSDTLADIIALAEAGKEVGALISDTANKASLAQQAAAQLKMSKLLSRAGSSCGKAEERLPADTGMWMSPYNLQSAMHSAGLYGSRNAYVCGGTWATVHSPKMVNISSGDSAHLKAEKTLELATANQIFISTKNTLDVNCSAGIIMTQAMMDISTISQQGNIATNAMVGKVLINATAGVDVVTPAAATITATGLVIIKGEKILLK